MPIDFSGGIFGVTVNNVVDFAAEKDAKGNVDGWFHYIQTVDGQPFEFSGRVTCLAIYDTPVLVRFPNVPAKTLNRAKWGALIEQSTDPTQPPVNIFGSNRSTTITASFVTKIRM